MNITCACGAEYASKTEPCPDGRPGCLVMHYAKDAHICPKCGADNVPDLSKGVSMEIGMGMGNLASILKLEMYAEKPIIANALADNPPSKETLHERMVAGLKYPPLFTIKSAPLEFTEAEKDEVRALFHEAAENIDIRENLLEVAQNEEIAGTFVQLGSVAGPARGHETLVMEDGTRTVREFDLPGGGTAQDIGQGEDDLQVFWPEARKRELLGLLGVPKEFLEGPTNFSSSEMALRCGSVMGAFGAEYQQEVQDTPHCATCGDAIDFHYRKNDSDKRLGPCRGHHTDCECVAFEERK